MLVDHFPQYRPTVSSQKSYIPYLNSSFLPSLNFLSATIQFPWFNIYNEGALVTPIFHDGSMTIPLFIVIFSIQWLSSLCVKAQIYTETENDPRGSNNDILLAC